VKKAKLNIIEPVCGFQVKIIQVPKSPKRIGASMRSSNDSERNRKLLGDKHDK
jgi:hypothetical protein